MGCNLRFCTVWFCFVLVAATVSMVPIRALDVAEEELRRTADDRVEFTNYEGPVSVSESVDMIRQVGEFLGQTGLDGGESREYFGRYRVVRAADSTELGGLDADIFMVLERARVDHIRNLRLMLSGYLQQAHGYTSESGSFVAELVTIYNAVYRGNLEFFEERYKPVVLEQVSADRVGLSTLYSDWPGGTEMIIPLRGERAVVDPFALADEEVVGELRERDDMGIAERIRLVSLMEDIVDLERAEIEDDHERILSELEDMEERERALLEQRQEAEHIDEDERARIEAATEREEVELADRMAEVSERIDDLHAREEELEEMQERVQEVRDSIAEDREAMAEEDDIVVETDEPDEVAVLVEEELEDTAIVFEVSRSNAGKATGRLVRVSTQTGEVIYESTIDDVVRPQLIDFSAGYLVTRLTGDEVGILQVVSGDDLDVYAEADEGVYAMTNMATHESSAYAVFESADGWRVGRFDEDLDRHARSEVTVNPDTYLYVDSERVIVQEDAGSFRVLDPVTLAAIQ